MKDFILVGSELALFIITAILGWIRMSQKLEDGLNSIKEWQVKHQVEANNRTDQIVDLRLTMAAQDQINKNISEKLDRILRYLEKLNNNGIKI